MTEAERPEAAMAAGAGSMTAREVRDTTLMLRRPTVVDRIQESVPMPEGAVPRNGLPCWHHIPLGSKLPIIDHPKDAFVFYRDKLGRGLWRGSQSFRLDDPYLREVDYTYEAVHDPALRRLHQSAEHRGVLQARGLVLPTEEAVCTLKQFNTYRRYLQTIQRELVKEEYRRRAVDLSDEQTMRRAQVCEQRQLEADQRRIEREKKHVEQRQRLEDERRKQQQMLVERQLHYLELLERVEERKREQRRLAVERAKKLNEEVRYRNAVAAEIQRAKVVATIQNWHREEKERTARLQQQQQQLQQYKERAVTEQWQRKIQCQEEREERDQRLLARQQEALKLAVELRNKQIEREDLRMQGLLKKIKSDGDKQRAKRLRRPARPARRARRRRGKDAGEQEAGRRRRRATGGGIVLDEEDMINLERVFNVSMQIVKDGREQGKRSMIGDNLWRSLREAGYDPTKTRNGVPEPVAYAIDSLLDAAMADIVHKRVVKTLKCVYHKVLGRCFLLLEEVPAREMARRGWVCRHGAARHSELRDRAHTREERACKDVAGEAEQREGEPRQPRRKPRQPRRKGSEEERQKLQRQIDALERKNAQLKKALEQTVSSTMSLTSEQEDARQAEMDLDANFEVLSKSLQKEMVDIAAQSLSEQGKLTTQHRWKMMKEVELSELVSRLCTMMMTQTPREFLKSTEFHWAADILARDVMREVRTQVHESAKKKGEEQRIQRAQETETISRRASPKTTPRLRKNKSVQGSEVHLQAREPSGLQQRHVHRHSHGHDSETVTEPLDESQVPLLRLHKRSPHQPSIPSLQSLA